MIRSIRNKTASRWQPGLAGRGFTLIEMSFVIAIVGLLLIASATKLRDSVVEASGEKLGNEAAVLMGAVNTYTAQYFEDILAGTAITGVVNNLSPTIAELKVKGGLSASFPVKNSQNTGWTIQLDNRVPHLPVQCIPPACDIESLVSTDAGILDLGSATPIPEMMVLGSAMRVMEAKGVLAGISDEVTPGTISGQNATWTAPNPAGAKPGVLAAKGGFGSQGYSQFVRQGDTRDITLIGNLAVNGANGVTATKVASTGTLTVAGQTTLTGAATLGSTLNVAGASTLKATTLNGALAANNGIATTTMTATGRVTGQYLLASTNITAGAACSPNGIISKDATGAAFACTNLTWASTATKPCVHGSFTKSTPGGIAINIPLECTSFTVAKIVGGGSSGSDAGKTKSTWDGGFDFVAGGAGGTSGAADGPMVFTNSAGVYTVTVGAGGLPASGPNNTYAYNTWINWYPPNGYHIEGKAGGGTSIVGGSISLSVAGGPAPGIYQAVSGGYWQYTRTPSNPAAGAQSLHGQWGSFNTSTWEGNYAGPTSGGDGGASVLGAGGTGAKITGYSYTSCGANLSLTKSSATAAALGAGGGGGAYIFEYYIKDDQGCAEYKTFFLPATKGGDGYISVTW